MSVLIFGAIALVGVFVIVMILSFIVLLAQGLHIIVQSRTTQFSRR